MIVWNIPTILAYTSINHKQPLTKREQNEHALLV